MNRQHGKKLLLEPAGLDAKTKAQVVVYNVLGMVIEKREVKPREKITIGDGYKPGTYIVELSQGKEKTIVKLIKQSK